MSPKSRRPNRHQADPSPSPARALTSNRSLAILGGIFMVLGASSAMYQQWVEAGIWLTLGVVMLATATPYAGRGPIQTTLGVALTLIALGLFIFTIARDASS